MKPAAAVCLAPPALEVEVVAAFTDPLVLPPPAPEMVELPTVVAKVVDPEVTVLIIPELEMAVDPEPEGVAVELPAEAVEVRVPAA
jgi:hypothetical protein